MGKETKHPFAEYVENEYKSRLEKEFSFDYLIQNINQDAILDLIDSFMDQKILVYKESLNNIVKLTTKMETAKTDIEYNIASIERTFLIGQIKTILEE